MKAVKFVALVVSVLMVSCTTNKVGQSETTPGSQAKPDTPVATPQAFPISSSDRSSDVEARWNVYDPNPHHIWNRLFRQLYGRTTKDGQEYGWDSLDPLLWHDTTFLLEGDSYQKTLSVVDEFLATKSEDLITDQLQRAMFQRDVWAVFDWLSFQSATYSAERRELAWRLAQVIRKVALTESQILALPNNYEETVKSNAFSIEYQEQNPKHGFLPVDLLDPGSEWVCLGRVGGPIAMTHTEDFPFLGRSVFLVFIQVPGGRTATLKFLQELNDDRSFTLPLSGAEVALVRRAILIDTQGDMIPSPITESVQIRHFTHVDESSAVQSFYEFQLSRGPLFADATGLQPLIQEFMLFRSHGDVFQRGSGEEQVLIPDICGACHTKGTLNQSFLSHSRFQFSLPDQSSPFLIQTTSELEAQAVITWKQKHPTWQALEGFANRLR